MVLCQVAIAPGLKLLNLIKTVSASIGFVLAARVRWNDLAVSHGEIIQLFCLNPTPYRCFPEGVNF